MARSEKDDEMTVGVVFEGEARWNVEWALLGLKAVPMRKH